MKSNEQFVNSFTNLTNAVNMQMGNFDFEKMSGQMEVFNTKMDEMMINGKMMNEMMNTNDVATDNVAEEMKQALQQEIAMEESNKLMEQEKK